MISDHFDDDDPMLPATPPGDFDPLAFWRGALWAVAYVGCGLLCWQLGAWLWGAR